jgi:hypothetical protein
MDTLDWISCFLFGVPEDISRCITFDLMHQTYGMNPQFLTVTKRREGLPARALARHTQAVLSALASNMI